MPSPTPAGSGVSPSTQKNKTFYASVDVLPATAKVRFIQIAEEVIAVLGNDPDVHSMGRACSGVDRAFLLTNSTERTEHQQIAFTRVAKQSGVWHIVKLSQLHAETNSPGRFLRYHAAVEAAVQASGLTFTFLRPNLYMQGLLNFRHSIQEKSAFFAAAGDARISAVDVRDLAMWLLLR